MSNRTTNGKPNRSDVKPRRSWQQAVFIVISVIIILSWVLSLVINF